ncbi:MAG: endonuclease/exonuclease/phosphatase family protein [Deltaproteobacteria bacterium]|nr:endonuclease/exonuclease/phosphatase family protein [Deltaproteobacteria bacterium]
MSFRSLFCALAALLAGCSGNVTTTRASANNGSATGASSSGSHSSGSGGDTSSASSGSASGTASSASSGSSGSTSSSSSSSSGTTSSSSSSSAASSSTTSSSRSTSTSSSGSTSGSDSASSGSGSGSGSSGASGSGSGSSGGSSGSSGGLGGTRVRVVAANLSSGNNQSYDPGEGIRILEGVHGDIMLMQEVNDGDDSPTAIRALVDAVCGTSCVYTRGSGQIPNAVVSRYPIIASGAWTDPSVSNRDFTWAQIDVPGPEDLWVVSVHLLTTNATVRDAEATSIVSQLNAVVPAGSLVVVGGDFNTDNRTEPCLTTLGAWFSTAAPYPADANGNSNTSAPRTRPYDWVLPTPELRALETPVAIGAAQFTGGLVVDTRVYTPLTDLAPALATDSGATGMQHMAVVRDFLLQ